jgi:hypothetical protein
MESSQIPASDDSENPDPKKETWERPAFQRVVIKDTETGIFAGPEAVVLLS